MIIDRGGLEDRLGGGGRVGEQGRSPFASRGERGHRGQVASPLCGRRRLDGLYDEPRPGAPRQIGERHRGSGPADAGRDAAGRDPLEPSLDGAGERPRALDHSSHLAGLRLAGHARRPSLSSDPFFVEKVRDIVGAVFGAAGSCPGSLCRRKEGLGSRPWTVPSPSFAPRARSGAATTAPSADGTTSLFRPSTSPPIMRLQCFPPPSGPFRGRSSTSSSEANGSRPAASIHIVMDDGPTRFWFVAKRRCPFQDERWFEAADRSQTARRLPRLHATTTNRTPKFKWTAMTSSPPSSGSRLRTIETAEQQAKIMRTSESGH